MRLNKQVLKFYIPYLVKSLKFPNTITTVDQYFRHASSKPSRDGYGWYSRIDRWASQGIKLYGENLEVMHHSLTTPDCLPVFPQMWAKAVADEKKDGEKTVWEEKEDSYGRTYRSYYGSEKEIRRKEMLKRDFAAQQERLNQQQKAEQSAKKETPMLESAKETVNTVIDQNKEAGMLAAELTVGRAANEFLMAKIMKTLPWYKRMFVGKDGSSWLGKLVVAQAANALIQQTSDNDRLQRIGEAMLKESVVEATVYSNEVTGLISGLEEAVSLPFLDKIMPNK